MSIKLRRDGPTYPTSVSSGVLTVYMGLGSFDVKLPFPTTDHGYCNKYFPVSNIMCYLENDEEIIVIRFDGTVTKFNHDYEVTGFTKMDVRLFYTDIVTLPVGCVVETNGPYRKLHSCSIRILRNEDICTFECTNDPEPLSFRVVDNPEFAAELAKGTQFFPSLIRVEKNVYHEDIGKYALKSTPILNTGFADV